MNSPAPWLQPGRVWSLWELMEFLVANLDEWVRIVNYFHDIGELSQSDLNLTGTDIGLSGESSRNALIEGNKGAMMILSKWGFKASATWLNRFNGNLLNPCKHAQIVEWCKRTLETIEDDAKVHQFLKIPSDRVDYYESGSTVYRLHSAGKYGKNVPMEIHEACNCYALGQYTACVMHCVRGLEQTIRDFAENLNVPLVDKKGKEKTWNTLSEQIRKKVKTSKPSTAKFRKRYEVRLAALDIFDGMRVDRNEASHAGKHYSQGEAKVFFHHTHSFLEKFAESVT